MTWYGPNWIEQKEKAKKRDNYTRQACDAKQDLIVHHREPIKTFDKSKDKWWEKANRLDNLITLCRSCHAKLELNNNEVEYPTK